MRQIKTVEKEEDAFATFRNRSRIEIIAKVLESAEEGAPKMHLIYGAKLSHKLGSSYVTHLLNEHLLEKVQIQDGPFREKLVYKMTDRGMRYLELYERINQIVFEPDSEGKTIETVGQVELGILA